MGFSDFRFLNTFVTSMYTYYSIVIHNSRDNVCCFSTISKLVFSYFHAAIYITVIPQILLNMLLLLAMLKKQNKFHFIAVSYSDLFLSAISSISQASLFKIRLKIGKYYIQRKLQEIQVKYIRLVIRLSIKRKCIFSSPGIRTN